MSSMRSSCQLKNSYSLKEFWQLTFAKINCYYFLMAKIFSFAILLTFVFVILFGLNLSMMFDKNMSNCPFTSTNSSVCQMPATDHLSKWMETFTAVPVFSNFLIFAIIIFVSFKFFLPEFALAPPAFNYKRYKFNYPDKLFDSLAQAFSDGILHSKIP